jgi:hypothetical protein
MSSTAFSGGEWLLHGSKITTTSFVSLGINMVAASSQDGSPGDLTFSLGVGLSSGSDAC